MGNRGNWVFTGHRDWPYRVSYRYVFWSTRLNVWHGFYGLLADTYITQHSADLFGSGTAAFKFESTNQRQTAFGVLHTPVARVGYREHIFHAYVWRFSATDRLCLVMVPGIVRSLSFGSQSGAILSLPKVNSQSVNYHFSKLKLLWLEV